VIPNSQSEHEHRRPVSHQPSPLGGGSKTWQLFATLRLWQRSDSGASDQDVEWAIHLNARLISRHDHDSTGSPAAEWVPMIRRDMARAEGLRAIGAAEGCNGHEVRGVQV
jgi:hypothetical protein